MLPNSSPDFAVPSAPAPAPIAPAPIAPGTPAPGGPTPEAREPALAAPRPPGSLNAFQYAWRSPWVRLIVFLLGFYLAYRFLGTLVSVIVTAAVGFLIAYLANPLLNWLERKHIQRSVGVVFVVMLFFGILAMAGALIATVSSQFVQLFQNIPSLISNLDNLLGKLSQWLADRGVQGAESIQGRLTQMSQTWMQNLGRNIGPILQNALNSGGTIFNGLLSIGGILGQVILILLLSVYLMMDYARVNASLVRAFPVPWQGRVKELAELIGQAVGGYMRGQLIIAAFIGVFVWIGLSVLGIPSAAAIGFLAGAFNIIPYLGPIVGATPAILLALTMPDPGLKIALVIGVFVAANQIESSFLSPYILSKNTDLHPVTVLISILVGAAVMGFAGALLAVPLVALIKLLLEKYYYPSRLYAEGP